MPLDITCSHCGKSFRVSDAVAGKHFRCVGCQGVLKAPDPAIPERPARPNPPPRRSERSNRPAALPPRSRPPEPPEPAFDDYEEDPFGYDQPVGASYLDMPGGPVGQPKRKPKRKPKPRTVARRRANPEAFEEYDRIVNEIAIFWIGLAVILGGFAVLTSLLLNDPTDAEKQTTLNAWMAGIAVSMFVVGLVTFTKSKIWLYALCFVCAMYLLASAILAIIGGCLLWILPVAFCFMYVRIGNALSAHP